MPGPRVSLRDDPETPRVWLTTFNDMITLLMVFFVLLFSMGVMDDRRFSTFQSALQSALGVMYEGRHAPEGMITDQRRSIDAGVQDRATTDEGPEPVSGIPRTEGLQAEYTRRGLELRLSDELLFASGSADLTREGLALLARIATVIKPLNRCIRVEGHTDNRPIATPRHPSNWELSTDRAVRVVRYFLDEGRIPGGRLSAAGYGVSRPRQPNDTPEGRAANRRVEIILAPMVPAKATMETEAE